MYICSYTDICGMNFNYIRYGNLWKYEFDYLKIARKRVEDNKTWQWHSSSTEASYRNQFWEVPTILKPILKIK